MLQLKLSLGNFDKLHLLTQNKPSLQNPNLVLHGRSCMSSMTFHLSPGPLSAALTSTPDTSVHVLARDFLSILAYFSTCQSETWEEMKEESVNGDC